MWNVYGWEILSLVQAGKLAVSSLGWIPPKTAEAPPSSLVPRCEVNIAVKELAILMVSTVT